MTAEAQSLHPQSITLAFHLMERMFRQSRRFGVRSVCFKAAADGADQGIRALSEGILEHVPGATDAHREELARLLRLNLVDIRPYDPDRALDMIRDGVGGLR